MSKENDFPVFYPANPETPLTGDLFLVAQENCLYSVNHVLNKCWLAGNIGGKTKQEVDIV